MGFFSWECCKSGESVWNDYSDRAEERGIVEGWIILPGNSRFQFTNYEGYGSFDVDIGDKEYSLSIYSVAGLHSENPELSDVELIKRTQQHDEYFDKGLDIDLGKDCGTRSKSMPRIVLGVESPDNLFEELSPPKNDKYQGFFYCLA